MSTFITDARPPRTQASPLSRPKPARRGKRFARRDRVEAGLILAAFALAFAFFGSQNNTAAPQWSWTTEQATSVNQELHVGAWLPLGFAANLSEDTIYRFCVTTQGTGTLLMDPSELISTVTLAGGAPVTTCADTHDLAGVTSVLPSVTVADAASKITVVESSWQRLELGGA